MHPFVPLTALLSSYHAEAPLDYKASCSLLWPSTPLLCTTFSNNLSSESVENKKNSGDSSYLAEVTCATIFFFLPKMNQLEKNYKDCLELKCPVFI